MRHGLSCSNVLDGCMTHIENVDQAFQPHIFDAVDRELVDTPFDRAVGCERGGNQGDDCTLVLERPDQTTAKVRLHDAYRDPKLTDCGVELSTGLASLCDGVYSKPAGDVLNIYNEPERRRSTSTPTLLLKRRRSCRRAFESGDQLDNEPRALDGASLVPDGVARNSSDWGQFLLFLGDGPARARSQHRGRPRPLRSQVDGDGAAVVFVAGTRLPPGGARFR